MFELAAPVGGTSSLDMYVLYLIVGMVPCYRMSFLHTFFPYTAQYPFYSSSPRIPLVDGFCSSPPVGLPPPIPLDTTHGGSPALYAQCCPILVPSHHEPFGYASRALRYHFPAFCIAWSGRQTARSQLQTPSKVCVCSSH